MQKEKTVPRFFREVKTPDLLGKIVSVVDGWCCYEILKDGVVTERCSTAMENILRNIKLRNLIWQMPKGLADAS